MMQYQECSLYRGPIFQSPCMCLLFGFALCDIMGFSMIRGIARVLYGYCTDIVQILYGYCVGIVQVLYGYCMGIVWVFYGSFMGVVQVLYGYFTGSVQVYGAMYGEHSKTWGCHLKIWLETLDLYLDLPFQPWNILIFSLPLFEQMNWYFL